MKNEIKVLKLVTGEEIITRMTEGLNGSLLLDRPMLVQLKSRDMSGNAVINIVHWSFVGNTENVTLESNCVLAIFKATPDGEKNYLISITNVTYKNE